MLQDQDFYPDLITDPRVRAALVGLVAKSTHPIQASDILAAAIHEADQHILTLLTEALPPGRKPQDLLSLIEGQVVTANPGFVAGTKEVEFSESALKALGEFQSVQSEGAVVQDLALEILIHAVLTHLTPEERQLLSILDVDRAASLFRTQIAMIVNPRIEGQAKRSKNRESEKPNASAAPGIPPEVAPSVDLTSHVQSASMPESSPYDGQPQYERIYQELARILYRSQCHHALLVGERGVGKSTLLAELARRGVLGKVPFLKDKRIISVDCRYVAPTESRQTMVAIMEHVYDRAELIVCLDGFASLLKGDIHTNKATLLSILARAQCRLIGLVTPHEFAEFLSADPDVLEFFAPVPIEEPDIQTARRLLAHFAAGLEQKYALTIDPEAIGRAVVLSANYILNDQLPAKALRILHSICEEIEFERSQLGGTRDRVTPDDVVKVVSETSGIPPETLLGIAEKHDYEKSLGELVVGQDHVVREVARELNLIKAGLSDPSKPASVMMLIGQTGTGKTELAKALARFYSTSKRLKTYTLGNFIEAHSVSGLIGVPSGYVGHDHGGRLINDLNSDPYGVFLLDEADKAHPDVLQPFLNLFDEGWIVDQRGVKAYADRAIFILTTNVGQHMISDMVKKGKSWEEICRRMKESLSTIRHSKANRPVFTPEFLARIKFSVVFKPLDLEGMRGISQRLAAEMGKTWLEKREKALDISDGLIEYVAAQAHDLNEKSNHKEGGRIVRKLFAEIIEAPMQRQVTQEPDAYQKCSTVCIRHINAEPSASNGDPVPPEIIVEFR